MITPIQLSPYLSELTNTNFYLKRDDLYPEGGGGNKARIVKHILKKAIADNADYLLTAGGPHSNFNRALALMAKQIGLPVRIVLYDKNTHLQKTSLNKRICDWLGVEYVFCDPNQVEKTIQDQLQLLKNRGKNPYFIWGGGKSPEGSKAYFDAVEEIKLKNLFSPDLLITTLATGTTFAGLSTGMEVFFPENEIWGISVARTSSLARPVVEDSVKSLKALLSPALLTALNPKAIIHDQFLMGGYGTTNPDFQNFLQEIGPKSGLILDEIYVGKALFGAIQLLTSDDHWKGKNVLFLLSGGVFNF